MQWKGNGQPPPDHTAILLDQTQELRRQSSALGWIVAQLQHGASLHQEFRTAHHEHRQDLALIKDRLKAVEDRGQSPKRPPGYGPLFDSLAGLLNSGRPYLIACTLLLAKWLGLGPSWIDPLIQKIVSAL